MNLLYNQKISIKILSGFIIMFVLLLILNDNRSTTGKVSHNNLTAPGITLAQNKPLKTIIVDNYYPYTFTNQQEQPDGFSVDLMKAVTQIMGLELEIKVDTWEHAMDALQTGEIDFLPMMAYSKERDLPFDFSAPHTVAYDAFFIRKDAPVILSKDDLRGKVIIVMKNDQAHDYLRSLGFNEAQQLIFVDSLPDAQRLLASGSGIVQDITERKQAEMQIKEHLEELRRWQSATMGRENRILELKAEVNKLLAEGGKPPHYASAAETTHDI